MAEIQPQKVLHKGVVKMVQSGDTVIIRGQPRGGPPPEKVLSFSGISAPRMGRRPTGDDKPQEKDEPMAWEAREFLRKKLVGQAVSFEVEYTAGAGGRDYGTVYLNGENMTKSILVAGLAKVRREEDADLVATADIAKLAQVGLYSDPMTLAKSVRNVKYSLPGSPAEFVEKFAGKEVTAIVEHVRDGSNFRVMLIPGMQSVSVGICGIRCPSFKRGDDGVDEPFAGQAKFFVESRLLQREVKLVFEGTSGPNALLASVKHPKGSIAKLLLAEGFAKINDNSVTNVREGREELRAAENIAKAQKKRIWKSYTELTVDLPEGERKFNATVVEIINPERIKLKKQDGSVLEVSLASLRQPRRPRRDEAQDNDGGDEKRRKRPLYEVPFMFEAREFLRELMIGKTVDVTIDFVKPAEGNYPEKLCATIKSGNINVAEGLISRGLATCLTHDQFRASSYDALLQAEYRAQTQKKGVHGGKHEEHVVKVGEITSKDSGQRYLNSLSRAGKVTGVVEYVSSGSRMRIYIQKETCLATFMLAGIQVPRTGFKDKPDEPFSVEAMNFVKDLCLQKTVQIQAIDTDSKGNMIGHVLVDGASVAETLVYEGLGSVDFRAARYGNEAPLKQAEATAQAAKKGMWANYDPTAASTSADSGSPSKDGATKPVQKVIITHVCDSLRFYGQSTSGGEGLTKLSSDLQTGEKAPVTPRKGQTVLAKFSLDGMWYRAKVERVVAKDKTYEVRFIDYGNTEETDVSKLAECPEEFTQLPPQATLMQLAILQAPPADYEDEAYGMLKDGILDKEYECIVEFEEEGTQMVSLIADDGSEDEDKKKINVAATMLRLGYARVGRTRERHLRDRETEFKKIQAEAGKAHVGMWMYGDISEDPRDI